MKNKKTFNDISKYLSEIEKEKPIEIEDIDVCKHEITDINNFLVCKICGSIINFYDYNFIDDQEIITSIKTRGKITKYSAINHLRQRIIDYTIKQQTTIEDNKYDEYYLKLIHSIPPKKIKEILKDSDIDYNIFFSKLSKNKPIYLQKYQIDKICYYADKFIKSKIIKSINNKALTFIICKHEFNIDLSDFVGSQNKNIIERYEKLYKQFKTIN